MKSILLACSLILAAALVVAQQRPKLSPDETRILALENAWNLAEEHKDAPALEELLAPTLDYTDYDGSFMNRDQFLASVKVPSLEPSQIVNDTMSVHLYGQAAVVTGIYREKGTLKGKPYQRHGRFTDTWINQDGVWRCVASQSTLISEK